MCVREKAAHLQLQPPSRILQDNSQYMPICVRRGSDSWFFWLETRERILREVVEEPACVHLRACVRAGVVVEQPSSLRSATYNTIYTTLYM